MERGGARPRPRAALLGEWSAPEREALGQLFPTVWEGATGAEILEQVHPSEIDVVVAAGPLRSLPKSLLGCHLIVFSRLRTGATLPGPIEGSYLSVVEVEAEEHERPELPLPLATEREHLFRERARLRGSPALVLTIPERPNLGAAMRDPTKAGELMRRARARREEAKRRFHTGAIARATLPKAAIGVRFIRADPRRGVAWLPEFPEPAGWVRALLEEWRGHDREAFPRRSDWREDPMWRTPEEEELLRQSEELERDRLELMQALQSRERKISERLAEARDRADRGVRRLLHGHGERLSEAAAQTLSALGFKAEHLAQDRGRGYLLVRDPEDPEWSALTLVRGFERRAGSASDLLRLASRAKRGVDGERPKSLWYVVNGPLIMAPPRRPPILEGKEAALREIALLGGAVIGTTSLYRLYHDRDELAEMAKASLKEARGRFRYPEEA